MGIIANPHPAAQLSSGQEVPAPSVAKSPCALSAQGLSDAALGLGERRVATLRQADMQGLYQGQERSSEDTKGYAGDGAEHEALEGGEG